MEDRKLTESSEESLEEKLDRINCVVQNTIEKMETSAFHPRNPSMISNLHSYTNSYCNFEWLDYENEAEDYKLPDVYEKNIESVLIDLDRTQMIVEDFWAESLRTQPHKAKGEDAESYIRKLEKENRDLRRGDFSCKKNVILNLQRNFKLEQERKNFEEKLAELDVLTTTYKTKHVHISELEESLRIKQQLLEQKEKDLRLSKLELEKSKMLWEQSVVRNTIKESEYENKKGKKNLAFLEVNIEAPPPNLILTPNRSKEIADLQQELKFQEIRMKTLTDSNEKSRIVTLIDQLKNKIATLRGEQVMLDCNKNSRIMKDMKRTMEKEVNYEENLRKSNLEKFTVKGRTGEIYSATPTYGLSSKRFLFSDD